MDKQSKACWIVDGAYFYHGARATGIKVCLKELKAHLERVLGMQITSSTYVTAAMEGGQCGDDGYHADERVRPSPLDSNRRFLSWLQSADGARMEVVAPEGCTRKITIECAHCGGAVTKMQQRGIDVIIATRIMEAPEAVRTLIITTGDKDFVPPIESVKSKHPDLKIVLLAFRHSAAVELQSKVHQVIWIDESPSEGFGKSRM